MSWPGCLACILWQCDIFLFCQFYSLQHILQMAPENTVKVCKMLLFPDLRTIFTDLELAVWIVKKTKATGQNYCSSMCDLGSIKINRFAQCFSKRKKLISDFSLTLTNILDLPSPFTKIALHDFSLTLKNYFSLIFPWLWKACYNNQIILRNTCS